MAKKDRRSFLIKLQLVTYYLGYIVMGFILITNTLHLFISTDNLLDPDIFMKTYRLLLLSLGLSLMCVAMIIEGKKTKPSYVFQDLSRQRKFAYLLVASILASSYKDYYPESNLYAYLTYGILIAFFYFLVPRLVAFYSATPLNRAYLEIDKSGSDETSFTSRHKVLTVVSITTMIVSLLIFGKTVSSNLPWNVSHRNYLRDNFSLTLTVPGRSTHGEKVVLRGYNLGWGKYEDPRYKVVTNDGIIPQVTEWTDSTITFFVPLHLKPGLQYIWAERPMDPTNKKSQILITNKVPLHIDSRFDYYPAESDSKIQRGIKKAKRILLSKLQFIIDTYKEL